MELWRENAASSERERREQIIEHAQIHVNAQAPLEVSCTCSNPTWLLGCNIHFNIYLKGGR